MIRVEVREVTMPGDFKRFAKCWWPIYADDPHWVPPVLFDLKSTLSPDNVYFKTARSRFWMAFRDGEAVGTIAATIDEGQQHEEPGVGYFGFFEFVDSTDIARALFNAATAWLAEEGMTVARGPYNLSPNHEFGLLVDGFDSDPSLFNPHNREYYQGIYESLGLDKAMDWYCYWMDKGPVPKRIEAISERFMSRHPEVTVRHMDMANYDEELMWFYDIYNDAWEQNWGHVKISKEEFLARGKDLKQIIDPKLCWWAFVDGEPAAASITFIEYNQIVKKMNGGLFPFGWYHWLFGRSKVDALRVFVLGVKQKYRRMPLGAPLYIATWKEGLTRDIRGADASLVLENNVQMRGALEKLGGEIYKTYRTYEIRLDADA
ncbi:MAG: GNAT family N-acetyltransferase [Proteobacteria bacterium]|nr:GNAT family N-acetyltransferase [Pseudomonadota bacterium]